MNVITIDYKPEGKGVCTVVPDNDNPIIMTVDGKLCPVMEISAQGFSCRQSQLVQGRRYQFDMDLPDFPLQLHGYFDVVQAQDEHTRYCEFVELNPDEVDTLHRFVLKRQKEAIRSLKAGSKPL